MINALAYNDLAQLAYSNLAKLAYNNIDEIIDESRGLYYKTFYSSNCCRIVIS